MTKEPLLAYKPCVECGKPTALVSTDGKPRCVWHIKSGKGILIKR